MFATILHLCTYAACNGYFVDTADSMTDCNTNLVAHSDKMAIVWNAEDNDKSLTAFLKENKIFENPRMLQDYDYTCEYIPEEQLP
ncbi:hypothetical protein D3C80_448490 [compost metagenome]